MLTTLLNPIVWLLVGVALASAVAARRGACGGDVLGPLVSWGRRPAVAGLAAVIAVLVAGPRVFLGYVAPGSYAEEVVAARELLAGSGTRSQNDREAFRQWLAEEPAPIAPWTLPGLSSCQANALQNRGHFFTAQGHPPFLLLASVPIVRAFGGRGAFIALTVLSLAAIALLARFLPGGDRPRTGAAAVTVAALLACWQPSLAALRQGDVTLLVAALALLAWIGSKNGHALLAGAAAGVAGSVSPGAVVLAFLPSRRSRFTSLTVLMMTTMASVLAAGPLVLIDYVDAIRTSVAAYASAPFNYTLVGRLPAAAGFTVAVAAVALTVWLAVSGSTHDWRPEIRGRRIDFALAACVALIPVLSPIAWSQHLAVLALPVSMLAVSLWNRNAAWLGLLAMLLLGLSLPDRPIAWIAHALAPESARALWPPLPLVVTLAIYVWTLAEIRRNEPRDMSSTAAA